MNLFSRPTGGGNRRIYTLSDVALPFVLTAVVVLAVSGVAVTALDANWSRQVRCACLERGAANYSTDKISYKAWCIRHVNGTDYVEPIEVPR
jgi:hypothetical protein